MVFLMILLFSYLQTSQQIQKTMVNGKEMLSNPRLKPVQGTLNVVMNQNVTLSCNSDSGSPPVRYTLFKRNQKVSTLNRPDLTPSLFNLTINSASDLGEYKCKAENNNTSGGKYSNSLSFTLLEPISKPVLSSPTSQAKKGQNVTLSCLSENGSLPITYIFFKGTQSISSQVMMHKEAAEIVLFINSSSDFGTYKCRAENGFRRNAKYSNGFNFTLAEKFKPTRPSTGFTSTPNVEEPEDEVIYSEIMPVKPEEEYINFSVLRREDEKGDKRVCATVYSRVLSRD
ncbi:allergin-1 isoform X6 [Pezoporus wallicus]|uniref:allergin-1 isoform X6 n=1 Tax=Pezoporus wallicus TaxID=35540 RepID=UPI00254A4773|nr:allergin-1 isoform X6 [Pezoporus wallicus]XP_061311331.1 allergin-1 isoform X5 [Pezoporus flaviventris]